MFMAKLIHLPHRPFTYAHRTWVSIAWDEWMGAQMLLHHVYNYFSMFCWAEGTSLFPTFVTVPTLDNRVACLNRNANFQLRIFFVGFVFLPWLYWL
jgi:hypothetical protein